MGGGKPLGRTGLRHGQGRGWPYENQLNREAGDRESSYPLPLHPALRLMSTPYLRYNGFGGKIDLGETPLEAAKRELKVNLPCLVGLRGLMNLVL